ncbi:MAG: aminotransferase class V-fold PLP-dependent enzyme [Gammaproteobacteria bacterium]|nr:aminotransferase class V-fold PLP-dependent enzyme [Gammaproteobacteria bacterium]
MNGHPEFPQAEGLIYLNHAAVAPWPKRTAEAVQRFAEENMRQGALHYGAWLETETRLREQLRWLINAESADDIALLKNTSEALSVVAYGLDWYNGDNVVITDQEFPSNRIVWESLGRFGVEVRAANLDAGTTPEDAVMAMADARTRLVSVSSVQYATGLRLDLGALGNFCRSKNILFCVDAIQSLGALRFDARACRADFVVADGHKWMLGPEGLALFYCRPEVRERLHLHQYGWHMTAGPHDFERKAWRVASDARRFECGSLNMLGVHALLASLSLLQEIGMDVVERNVLNNAQYIIDIILVNSDFKLLTPRLEQRHAGIVTFKYTPVDQRALQEHLARRGVVCARRAGGIRYSPHFYTSTAQLETALRLVTEFTGQQ